MISYTYSKSHPARNTKKEPLLPLKLFSSQGSSYQTTYIPQFLDPVAMSKQSNHQCNKKSVRGAPTEASSKFQTPAAANPLMQSSASVQMPGLTSAAVGQHGPISTSSGLPIAALNTAESTSLCGLSSSLRAVPNADIDLNALSRTIELSRQLESQARKQRIQELLSLNAFSTNAHRAPSHSSESINQLLNCSISRMVAPQLSVPPLATTLTHHSFGLNSMNPGIARALDQSLQLRAPPLSSQGGLLELQLEILSKGSSQLVSLNKAERKERFPVKLLNMILAAESEGKGDIVSFTPSGRGFVLHNPDRLEKDLLPRFLGKIKYSSFKRQLHLYEFKYVSKGPEAGSFSHPLFYKGNPDACTYISRPKRLT